MHFFIGVFYFLYTVGGYWNSDDDDDDDVFDNIYAKSI